MYGLNVHGSNLSFVWGRVFVELMRKGVESKTPLQVTIEVDGGAVAENADIRQHLDGILRSFGKPEVHTVANLLFPQSTWAHSKSRQEFYDRYLTMLPRLKKRSRRGTYYERLIAHNGNEKASPFNQLEHAISAWNNGIHRHSALQASILIPHKDLNYSPRQGFPCLQQISFLPLGTNGSGGLLVSAYYPTQYIVERAYGNYLGLVRLGNFMASQMGLELKAVTCHSVLAKLGELSKAKLSTLEELVQKVLVAEGVLKENMNAT